MYQGPGMAPAQRPALDGAQGRGWGRRRGSAHYLDTSRRVLYNSATPRRALEVPGDGHRG
jgi:hypothetical protein